MISLSSKPLQQNSPSAQLIAPNEFESVFLAKTHWIDVRAPIEFQSGAIPGSVNLPLLTNEERHAIGITYKEKGQQAAIDLGHSLVCGPIREARMQGWANEIKKYPSSVIYCFRGGLRSQIVQRWLKEIGIDCPIIIGGYKTLRKFLLNTLETRLNELNFKVVCGPTGSGKTTYLQSSGAPFLDLEALAKHRGSAFGALEIPQPCQVDFENELAIKILILLNNKNNLNFDNLKNPEAKILINDAILIEDESRMIGKCEVPKTLFNKIKTSPKITLDVNIEDRVETIYKDYILNSSLGLRQDITKFESFRHSVRMISQKLGGQRAQEILQDINNSQIDFEHNGTLDINRQWIRKLLCWYYDPLY
jgi:tRNA 2-selenouridine synthase